MENVAVDWVGSAIGGAAAAAAWAGSQLWNAGSTVVDGVVDAFEALQPQPYEEWLNAPPAQSPAPTLEFRNPKNETNRTPTAEEIITSAALQEVQTGVSSPIGPNDPNEYQQLIPAEVEQDPQKPLNQEFNTVPEPRPASSPGQNVVMTYTNSLVKSDTVIDPPGFYVKFRGRIEGGNYAQALNKVVFSGYLATDADGNPTWKARVQAFMGATVRRTWTFDAGRQPPTAGDFGLYLPTGDSIGTIDVLAAARRSSYITVRTYSLNQPDLPPPVQPVETDIPLNDSFFPLIGTGTDIPVNADGQPAPIYGSFGQRIPQIPVIPGIVSPTAPNNPLTYPVIGSDGLPVPNPNQIPTTAPDVHVIGETPVNSGGTRASLRAIGVEVGRIEQKAAQLLDRVGEGPGKDFNWTILWGALQLIAEILEKPLPSETYTITEPCSDNPDNPRSTSVTLPKEKWAERLISLGDMMPELLQAHKDYKQPTCGTSNEKPPLEGQWVTTRWLSTEKMDHSGVRLRKLFRYRTKSTRNLGQLSAYWEAFTWEAGAVCVFHKGAWWGTPQIWAASQEEGQRVIRFAAAEAGLNPDQVGEWGVGSSRSPRYGMSGTMKIHLKDGFPWVSARESDSWPNVLAKQHGPYGS